MKKLLFVVCLLFIYTNIYGQDRSDIINNRYIPHIETIGYAEEYVTPDEIHLSLTITGNAPEDSVSISLDDAEKKLRSILASLNIGEESISLKKASSDYYTFQRHRQNVDNNIPQKHFEIRLNNCDQFYDFLDLIPSAKEGFTFLSIAKLKRKNMDEQLKYVRLKALQEAKNKATEMAKSEERPLGKILSSQNIDESLWDGQPNLNILSDYIPDMESQPDNSPLCKIKLTHSIRVQFYLY